MSELTGSPSDPIISEGNSPRDSRLPPAPPHTSYRMYGGLTISNEEGVRWLKEKYGMSLAKDHSEDATVRMTLENLLTKEEGWPSDVRYAPPKEPSADGIPFCDFLAVTQSENGVWEHQSWGSVDIPEHQMKGDTAQEERMREILQKLGLKAGEFQCLYSML